MIISTNTVVLGFTFFLIKVVRFFHTETTYSERTLLPASLPTKWKPKDKRTNRSYRFVRTKNANPLTHIR